MPTRNPKHSLGSGRGETWAGIEDLLVANCAESPETPAFSSTERHACRIGWGYHRGQPRRSATAGQVCLDLSGARRRKARRRDRRRLAGMKDPFIYNSENGGGWSQWLAVRDNGYVGGQFSWTGCLPGRGELLAQSRQRGRPVRPVRIQEAQRLVPAEPLER